MLYLNTYHCNMFDVSTFEDNVVNNPATGSRDKCAGGLSRAATAKITNDLPQGDGVWISFEFMSYDYGGSNYIFSYKHQNTPTVRLRVESGTAGYRLALIGGTTVYKNYDGIVYGRWHRIDFNVDKVNKKVVVYLNNSFIYEEPFSTIADKCTEISFDTATKNYTFFRNIIITDEFDTRGYKVQEIEPTISTDWNATDEKQSTTTYAETRKVYSTDETEKTINFDINSSISDYIPKKLFLGMNTESSDTVNAIEINMNGNITTKYLNTNFISVINDIEDLNNKHITITSKYRE